MNEVSDYDRAISAYQLQVERYHTWMNYYSIFEGALFVAFYSIDRCKVGDLVYLLIPILGFIVSLCWLGSIVGHRCWMNSWLDIVKKLECEEYNKKNIITKIYNSYSNKQSKKDFLSTQVITQIFISFVIVAWGIILLNLSLFALIGGIIAIIVAYKLYKKEDSCIHSKIKNMKPLILSLLIIITFSNCDNINRKDNNNSQDYVEIKEQNVDNKKTEEVKDPMVSLDKSLMMTAIDELLYNPDFLGYVINGASITRTMADNLLKIQRWIDNTRNSEYPFVFIKAKINSINPLENGCNIIASSNSFSARELDFYVANDEELYNMSRGDEVYFWALPMKVTAYRCYFEIAFVSKYIHTLVEKISDYSNLYVELVTTNSETNRYNLNSKLTKMEHYSGLNFNDELRDMIEKTVGKHVEVYNFTYDKYFKDKGETEVVGIDKSKGLLIIDIE